MADLVRFAILHGFKSQGGFAVDLKRPNRWCKDHVLMISSPSARARPGGGWLRDGAVPVADVDSFATFTSGRRKPPSEGLVSNGASSRRPIEIQRLCASAARRDTSTGCHYCLLGTGLRITLGAFCLWNTRNLEMF